MPAWAIPAALGAAKFLGGVFGGPSEGEKLSAQELTFRRQQYADRERRRDEALPLARAGAASQRGLRNRMLQTVEVCFTISRGNNQNTQFGAITLATTLVSQEVGTSATQVTTLTAGALSLAILSGASTAEQTCALQVTIDVDAGVTTFNALFDGWMTGGSTIAGEAPYIDSI